MVYAGTKGKKTKNKCVLPLTRTLDYVYARGRNAARKTERETSTSKCGKY